VERVPRPGRRVTAPIWRPGHIIGLVAAGLAFCVAGTGDAGAYRYGHRHAEPAKREPAQKLPPGPLQLVVSISNQTVTVYAGGAFVARAPVSTGVPGHPTPTGVFTVIHKEKWHRSNLYSGAPMPYMQRITWSGVALHAGVLPGYPASHGCIRMPYDFAVKLYALTRPGVRVIVSRGDAAPVDVVNPHLFTVKPKPDTAAQPLTGFDAIRASLHPTSDDEKRASDSAVGADGDRPMIKIAVAAAGSDGPVPDGAATPISAPTAPAAPPRKLGPISVLVSRKTGKLYVRQNFQIVFEAAVTIREPERPLGIHVFTAMELKDDGASMRWTALTMPADVSIRAASPRRHGRRHEREEAERAAPADPKLVQSAGEALDRIEMPPEAVERISEIITPGSSLIVSDQGISDETGSDTDFIILTR